MVYFYQDYVWSNRMNTINRAQKIIVNFFALLILAFCGNSVSAQVIDDITLNTDTDGAVVASIKLSSQVQYVRHFPEKRGEHLEIYFKILGNPESNPLQGFEARTSPPSSLIPGFTVTVRDLITDPKNPDYKTSEPKLVIEFSRPADYKVRLGKNERSFVITIQPDRITIPLPPAAALPPVGQLSETDREAAALLTKGREALLANQFGVAIESFNKILLLQSNIASQEAQELVGVARESAGQKFKAKLEYESYLKTYNTGEGAERVKNRLTKLKTEQPVQLTGQTLTASPETIKEQKAFQTITNGSISANYYFGQSLTDLSGSSNVAAWNKDTSMLITSVNASLRTRNDRYDNRLVFQDTHTKNLLSNQSSSTSPNRLSTLYYDFKDKKTDLSARIGRQSPTGGGVMGRFDGITTSYGINSKWQANASAGRLSDYGTGSKPVFYGAGVGLGNSERWGGSVYYVNQSVYDISDRNAIGTEMRYFDANKNAFAMIDYDVYFRVLNTVLVQGTLNSATGNSYNFLIDHRKTPSISLSNALIGSPSTSLKNFIDNGWAREDIKKLAELRTASSNSAQLGVTRQIREKWQAGADVSVSNTTGTPESGTKDSLVEGLVSASPSTGNNIGINARIIGNGVFTARDVTVCSLGMSTSSSMKGQTFLVNNHLTLAEKWSTDASLRLYWQTTSGTSSSKETITSPTFRVAYQARNNLNFEADGGFDFTNNTPDNGQSSKTTRRYFSLGLRSDF
jgi:hypothetical protein